MLIRGTARKIAVGSAGDPAINMIVIPGLGIGSEAAFFSVGLKSI